ncbi:BrnT family toxin, partial [Acinetobacter baumannii]
MEHYFEWDESKNRKNQKKHDISFETASLVFEDP